MPTEWLGTILWFVGGWNVFNQSNSGLPFPAIVLEVTTEMRKRALHLAEQRLKDATRWHSAHRITSRNLTSQFRGALGEVALVAHLMKLYGTVDPTGSEMDDVRSTDVVFPRGSFEIMTAQVAHRLKTGFCVPPNKLRAAQARSADGYIFVGTDSSPETQQIFVQAWAPIAVIDVGPSKVTSVSANSPGVENFVVEHADLRNPVQLFSS